MKIHAKQPGRNLRLRTVDMRFGYCETFETPSPDAYENLLWDVLINDETLFMRADQVEAAWEALMPVLDAWATLRQTVSPTTLLALGGRAQPRN